MHAETPTKNLANELARERNRQSADRTLMAWVRTARAAHRFWMWHRKFSDTWPMWILCSGLVLTLLLMSSPARAGAIWLYESGGPDLGTAAAGRAAMALDASTAFGNPAGMTNLNRTEFVGSLMGILPSGGFRPDASSSWGPWGQTGDVGNLMPAASGFFVYKLSDRWRLGASLTSYLGISANYGDAWAGRYYLQSIDYVTISFAPTVAYRVNDWLSIGVGPNIVWGRLKQSAAINNTFGLSDGRLTLDDNTFGFGGIAGIMIEPQKGTRIGVSYLSPVQMNFSDVASASGVGPILSLALQRLSISSVNMKQTLPQQVMVSIFHELNDKLALMANFGWQNWRAFGKIGLEIDAVNPISITADSNLKDTYHGALGLQYKVAPQWLWSLGFAYDSAASSSAYRNPTTAFDRQFRYATGIQYAFRDNITFGLAYELADMGKAPMNIQRGPLAGRITGYFPSHLINFVAGNIKWQF
jgi:long-chain fatty acid transport protein